MVWVCGVDGFKSQWCAVVRNLETNEFRTRLLPFANVLNLLERPAIVCVDVPIGLPDVTLPGGRSCECLAREKVGPRRSRSVFSAVGRIALKASFRAEADQLSRASGGIGVGAHAWALAKKLLEVDAVMTPARQQLIREVHPELSFGEMACRPLDHSKKTLAGERERVAALIARGLPESFLQIEPARLGVGRDGFLDACAALWTAERIYDGAANHFPRTVERDPRGLDMAMWY
jgi:predicted RNase H-like nuclease